MQVLTINDENNQTRQWWINFLLGTECEHRVFDLEKEFNKWGAKFVSAECVGMHDAIAFENEEDMTWFLLKWS